VKKEQVSLHNKKPQSSKEKGKQRPWLFLVGGLLLLFIVGSAGIVSYGWWRSNTTALVQGEGTLIKALSRWLQKGDGSLQPFTSEQELPWYFRGERQKQSVIKLQELSGWEEGPLAGASLLAPTGSQEKKLFFFDGYGLFVPAGMEKTGLPFPQFLIQGGHLLLIAGADDGILFAFLSALFAHLAPSNTPSLPELLSQAIAENNPSLVGFDAASMMHLDENAPFFSQKGGKALLAFLRTCQKEGLLTAQWQFYTQEDIHNDFQWYEKPLLFGPYGYKKGPFMKELAFYRMYLSIYDKGPMPVRVYTARLYALNPKSQEVRFFAQLTSPTALQVFNEETPFLTLSLAGPYLNQEHRFLLDVMAQSTLFPLGSEQERKENALLLRWLEALRNLLRT